MLLLVCTFSARGQGVIAIEGESYFNHRDHGGGMIRISYCSAASGHYIVDGIDSPGDWIDLELSLPFTGCLDDLIGCQGYYNYTSTIQMSVIDPATSEEILTSDFVLTGQGTG
jgi:hypothetical protein